MDNLAATFVVGLGRRRRESPERSHESRGGKESTKHGKLLSELIDGTVSDAADIADAYARRSNVGNETDPPSAVVKGALTVSKDAAFGPDAINPWLERRITETAVVDKPAEEEDHGHGHHGHAH